MYIPCQMQISGRLLLPSLFSLSFLCCLCLPLSGQDGEWVRANEGMWGGEITALRLTADGGAVVGTGDGIYRADDVTGVASEAIEWRRASSFPDVFSIQRAADGTLYATNGRAIHYSTDNGRSWEFVLEGEIGMVAGVDRGAMIYYEFRSRILHFYELDGSRDDTTTMYITARPDTEPEIYNGADGRIYYHTLRDIGIDRIYRFDDNSLEYHRLEFDAFPQLRTVDEVVYLTTDSILTNGPDGIKRSVDGGSTWQMITDPEFGVVVGGRDGHLYASPRTDEDRRLYRSDDFGLTWRICSDEWPGILTSSPLTAVTADGGLMSKDGEDLRFITSCEEGWHDINRGIGAGLIEHIVEGPDGKIYATRYNDVDHFGEFYTPELTLYASEDGGRSWRKLIDDINELVGVDAASNIYVRYDSASKIDRNYRSDPYAVILQSRDGRETWDHILRAPGHYEYFFGGAVNSPPVVPVGFQATSAGIVRISIQGTDGEAAPCNEYVSVDSGSTFSCWDPDLGEGLRPDGAYRLDKRTYYLKASKIVGDPGFEVVVGTTAFLYDPITGTATEVSPPEMESSYWMVADSAGNLYGIGGSNGASELTRSTDRGETWETMAISVEPSEQTFWKTGLRAGRSGELYLTGATELYTNRDRFRYARLYGSTDGGETWRDLTSALTGNDNPGDGTPASLPVITPHDLILDTAFGTLVWSTDRGNSWTIASGELDGKEVTSFLQTSDGTTLVGTRHSGLYRLDSPLSSAPPTADEPISAIPILSLQPNPVTGDEVRLKIRASGEDDVRIELFNVRGERVRTIFDGSQRDLPATLNVDLRGLSAGAYLVRLNEGTRRTVARLIVE